MVAAGFSHMDSINLSLVSFSMPQLRQLRRYVA
jgi:hypothetical protein